MRFYIVSSVAAVLCIFLWVEFFSHKRVPYQAMRPQPATIEAQETKIDRKHLFREHLAQISWTGDSPPPSVLPELPLIPDADPTAQKKKPCPADKEHDTKDLKKRPYPVPLIGLNEYKLAKSNTEFAFELYKQLANDSANIVFSPFSISTVFAVAHAGGRGETAQQMRNVLRFELPDKLLHPTFGNLIASITIPRAHTTNAGRTIGWTIFPRRYEHLQLSIANALWVQKGYELRPSFVSNANRHYRADVRQLDFRADPNKSKDTVNRWVADKTCNRIREILNDADPRTRLILANAAYFKDRWILRFLKSNTKIEKFYLSPSKSVQAPLMHRRKTLAGFYQEKDFKLLRLIYGTCSMYVLLPTNSSALVDLEKRLDANWWYEYRRRMKAHYVDVWLPKFQLESTFTLNKSLQEMGMTRAFTSDADFNGIATSENLMLSSVIHQASLDVDDSDPAAATTIRLEEISAGVPPPPIPDAVFRADRPFVFLIQVDATGSILFCGRVVNPLAN